MPNEADVDLQLAVLTAKVTILVEDFQRERNINEKRWWSLLLTLVAITGFLAVAWFNNIKGM
jgi:hypothetical protein